MSFFSRKKEVLITNICPKCSMELSDLERTLRYIKKDHKPKKKFECDLCESKN